MPTEGQVPDGQQPRAGNEREGPVAVSRSHAGRRQHQLLLALVVVLLAIGAGALGLAVTRGADLPPELSTPSAASTDPAIGAPSSSASQQSPNDPPSHTAIAALPRSVPLRVVIPSIGVDSPLMMLGLQTDGTLQVPPGPTPAGWFDASPTPGSNGAAVIAGHVTYNGRGVFFHLAELKPGAYIQVVRTDGRTAVFTVTSIESFPKDRFPTIKVYGTQTDVPELRLLTCTGDYDPVHHNYPNNLVVFAHLTAVTRPT